MGGSTRELPARDEALARLAPMADVVRAAAGNTPAWLVGGVVRDALLGRDLPDLDIVVHGDPEPVARALRRALGGSAFPLSDEFGCWRVTIPEGESASTLGVTQVDVCALRDGSLTADLNLRDFTINALALDASAPAAVVDRVGGLADLDAGVVRVVADRAIDDDPLRMLRAARIAHMLGMVVEDHTRQLVRTHAGRAVEPAGERTFAELTQLVCGHEARRAVRLLDELALVDSLLPELAACKGVTQSAFHHLDVYEHTLAVLDNAEDIAAAPGFWLGSDPVVPFDAQRIAIIRFAALSHDLGKPQTRAEWGDGRVSFLGHDEAGLPIVDAMCDRWAASNSFRNAVKLLVRTHLGLGMLLHGELDRRARYRYLRTVQPWGAEAVVLSAADRMATAGPADRRSWVRRHLEAARLVWDDARAELYPGLPTPLLDGLAIAEAAGMEPGPGLGDLVAALAEEQAVGTVTTEDEARTFIRQLAAGNQSS